MKPNEERDESQPYPDFFVISRQAAAGRDFLQHRIQRLEDDIANYQRQIAVYREIMTALGWLRDKGEDWLNQAHPEDD